MELALSALAVALLTAVAWAMGFRRDPVLDEAAARAEAEGRLAGFRARDVALARGGRGALVRGADGSFALLLPLGDGWVARRLPASALALAPGPRLRARVGEPLLGEAQLPLAVAPDWLQAHAA